MKTTVDIDEAVLKEAEDIALRDGRLWNGDYSSPSANVGTSASNYAMRPCLVTAFNPKLRSCHGTNFGRSATARVYEAQRPAPHAQGHHYLSPYSLTSYSKIWP